jgi:TRAP-type C4-dicarboxylate transport system substrate-binding protein
MKRMKNVICAASMVILLGGIFMLPQAFGQEKQILIRYSHQHPTNFSFHKGAESFCKYVEQKTNGRVKFEMYPASQLYKASETIKAVASGAVDMGHVVVDEFGTNFPLGYISYLPYMANNDAARLSITEGKIHEMMEKEAARIGVKLMFYMPHDINSWIGNNKRPLKILKDFEGVLIRTTPGEVSTIVALGGKGVRMNVDEVYMAMQRGTVDGCLSRPSSATNRRWEEVSKYTTIFNMAFAYNQSFINMNLWNKLPPDIQKIMLEGNRVAQKYSTELIQKDEADAIEILKKKTQLHVQIPDESAQWEKATRVDVDDYLKKGGTFVKEAVEELSRIKKQAK